MKVICQQEKLNFGIQTVSKAISSKVIEPIYGNIKLETSNNNMRLIATSGDISIEILIGVDSVEKEGSITVPSRELGNLIGSFNSGKVEIESDDIKLITITSKGCHYQLNGLPSDQFPSMQKTISEDLITINQETLKNMIKETFFAIAPPDEVRAVLKGSLFEIEGENLTVVSADGRRMAKKTGKLLNSPGKNFEIVVPKKTLNELIRILSEGSEEEVNIFISDSQIDFHIDNIRILSSIIQGKFPNYRQVIPTHCEQSLRINKENLYKALKRASFIAQDLESPNLVKFKVHGSQIIITANTQDVGQAYEEVDLEEPAQSLDIAFNAKYLIDALSSMATTEIIFELSNPVNPGIIKPAQREDYLYVIMPVRLK
ncbi:MAG TPA: DNA polymerase III subunit beta [Candidatus Eremiobacteraeota bacterium]|nr:MAG: DNA polymerase III subunit beta [bacterium ADurb.Bin363]HPZ09389.1 DNA polymerase III subunit beta [Candidatus Eremiobacteraeota bacterium]